MFFAAIVFSFSALMLISSLLCSIKLAALKDAFNKCEKQCAELEAEVQRLCATYESLASVEEIERYALEVLGMQQCTAEQIEVIRFVG